ncbi:MAG: hypothetical protein HC867_10305 [Bacteroidia bacterium]|nr:hypothetical protein [Bacteroidia bacterium]
MNVTKSGGVNLQQEKERIINEYFEKTEFYTDINPNEPYWLKENAVAKVVADSLHFLSQLSINLWAFCIMPNHVHVLFNLKDDKADAVKILQQHKSFTAKNVQPYIKA